MQLIDCTGAIDDLWPRVAGDDPLPAAGRALVDLARFGEARTSGLELGVHIPNDTPAEALVPHFPRIALVSVAFPSFADGRGFSLARTLRGRGFRGRLRATGPVIADQFGSLLAVGFDEVAIPAAVAARQPVARWLAEAGAITLGYQRGVGSRASILDRRRSGHA